MPQLVLKIRYNKNEGFLVSPTEVMDKYLVGVPLCTRDGRRMPLSAIKTNIAAAQKRFENLFSIRFQRQVIAESKDFNREEFNRWGFIKETFQSGIWDDSGVMSTMPFRFNIRTNGCR